MGLFKKVREFFKLKKWIAVIAGVLVVLVVLLIAAHFFLGHIVKSSIETIGPMITGVPVSVRKVNIDLLGDFGVSVRDLVVGNPKGYSSPYALKMKKFDLKVKTFSLLTDKIIIDKLLLTGLEVNYETSLIASNLNDIKNNVDKFAGSGEKKAEKVRTDEEVQPETESGEKESLKLQANAVDIADITVRIIARGGDSSGVPLMMVPIHMKDVGKDAEGVSVSGLIREMFTKLFTGVVSLFSSGADAVNNAAKEAGNAVEDAAKEAGNAVKKAGKNIGNTLKELFSK